MGAPLIAAAQVIVYIGAISVLILFAIMLTQTKDAPEPPRLPDPGRAGGDRRRSSSRRHRPRRRRPPTGARRASASASPRDVSPASSSRDYVLAVRGRQRAAARRGDRRRVPGQARTGRTVVSDSLDAYLVLAGILFAIGSFGFLARRNAISMLMSIELMLNGVNLVDRRVRRVHPGARRPGLGHRPDGHGGRRRRSDRRPRHRHRHLPQQADAAGRRIRRHEAMSVEAASDGRCARCRLAVAHAAGVRSLACSPALPRHVRRRARRLDGWNADPLLASCRWRGSRSRR